MAIQLFWRAVFQTVSGLRIKQFYSHFILTKTYPINKTLGSLSKEVLLYLWSNNINLSSPNHLPISHKNLYLAFL